MWVLQKTNLNHAATKITLKINYSIHTYVCLRSINETDRIGTELKRKQGSLCKCIYSVSKLYLLELTPISQYSCQLVTIDNLLELQIIDNLLLLEIIDNQSLLESLTISICQCSEIQLANHIFCYHVNNISLSTSYLELSDPFHGFRNRWRW